MPTRQERKVATRAALLQAARECLESQSFGSTAIRDIAEQADVAVGTFYVHFRNKQAVLDALLDEFNEQLVAQLGGVWEELGGTGPEALVRALAERCLDYWEQRSSLLEAFVRAAAQSEEVVSLLRDGLNPPVAQFLERGLKAFPTPPESGFDPRLVTQGLLGLWTRVGLQYVFGGETSRDLAVETLTRMTLGALNAVLPLSD